MGYGFLVVGVVLINLSLVNWYLVRQAGVDLTPVTECDRQCIEQIVLQQISQLPQKQAEPVVAQQAETVASAVEQEVNAIDSCDEACVLSIVQQELSKQAKTTQPTVSKTATTTTAPKTEEVNLAGGTTKGSGWLRVTGTTIIDTALYGELVSATWQGWVDNVSASGKVRVRLYDLTNARVVDGSEVEVNTQGRASFFSAPLSIWRGQNEYVIEILADSGGEVEVSGALMKLSVK